MANVDDPRLERFVRGELTPEEIEALEVELDRRPSLQLALAERIRSGAGAPRALGEDAAPGRIVEGHGRVVVGPTLGEGGMSTVRKGVQTNLGRAVAVKMLRDETTSGTHRLLQEARLTARLQHPNIVPVHEILYGPSGELQIVLKQVEGVLWASVMHRPEVLLSRFGVADPLDWNLGVLVAICHALAYAHDRGVVHRDVKPSNVMVGHFGEVYLLDWGIAAQFGERADPDLAHVDDAPIAGTLAFMAPEQLEGDPDAIGPWTDVYLLGATLYEVLGGAPPHARASKDESRQRPRARAIAPLDEDVPPELVAIAMQALSPNPENRPLGPQAFRAELTSFRIHRGSLDLVQRAERFRRLAREAASEVDRADVERHLGEAEFGYRAALEAWPENERAREGLRELEIQRIQAALDDGQVDVAKRRLEALTDPPDTLRVAVLRASATSDARRAEADQAVWQRDASVGVVVRGILLAAFGPFWVLGWVSLALWPLRSLWPLEALLVGYLLVGTVMVLSQGLAILQNQVQKANILGAGVAVGSALAWTVSADWSGLDPATAERGILLVFGLTLVLVALTIDLRALGVGLFAFAAFAFATVAPSYTPHALAVCTFAMVASMVTNNILLRRRLARERAGEPRFEVISPQK